jgi:adenylate kinase family enzyme
MELPDITDKNVLIIGCPASGKTYVSGLLDNDKHRVVHTDRYIDLGHKESLYNLLDGLSLYKGLTIVEGVLGYRLLRKGLQTGEYFPDLVIELRVNEETMLDTYKYKRDPLKVKRLKSFNKAHRTILDEYLKLPNDRPPEWYIIQNDY